jgi:hypothetical protein
MVQVSGLRLLAAFQREASFEARKALHREPEEMRRVKETEGGGMLVDAPQQLLKPRRVAVQRRLQLETAHIVH